MNYFLPFFSRFLFSLQNIEFVCVYVWMCQNGNSRPIVWCLLKLDQWECVIFHNSFPFISFKYKTILVNMTKRSNLLSLRHFDYSFTHIFININADSFIIYGSVYMWTSPEPIRRFRLHRYWVLRDGPHALNGIGPLVKHVNNQHLSCMQ